MKTLCMLVLNEFVKSSAFDNGVCKVFDYVTYHFFGKIVFHKSWVIPLGGLYLAFSFY